MTAETQPSCDFTASNGAIFRYRRQYDGNGIQVWILNADGELLAGFPLAADQVIELFHTLDFCEECGKPVGDDTSGHGPGRCSDADDPGGDLD